MEFDVRSTPERPRAVFSHVDGRGRVFVLECARPGSAVRPEPGSTQVACLALRTP